MTLPSLSCQDPDENSYYIILPCINDCWSLDNQPTQKKTFSHHTFNMFYLLYLAKSMEVYKCGKFNTDVFLYKELTKSNKKNDGFPSSGQDQAIHRGITNNQK